MTEYESAAPLARRVRRAIKSNGIAAIGPPRPAHPMHGVGAQQNVRYCGCGSKKRNGLCLRGCSK